MKKLWAVSRWWLAFAVGYHIGYGDGIRWGRLIGRLDEASMRLAAAALKGRR